MTLSVEKVRSFFAQRGREQDILEFDMSSATVELAAVAVGCEPARIAKTLSFSAEEGCILVVCAGDARIDNPKFKARFHTKAKMLSPDEVLSFTGHAVGGVCPFAVTEPAVRTYLDESLKRFSTVYPAAGSSNSAIELSLSQLEEYSRAAGWVDVCKDWNGVD